MLMTEDKKHRMRCMTDNHVIFLISDNINVIRLSRLFCSKNAIILFF